MSYSFDYISSDYKKISLSQSDAAMQLISLLKQSNNFKVRQSVLDIGCASAVNTESLINSFSPKYIIGIDVSKKMIGIAKEFFYKDNSVNISFLQKNIMHFKSKRHFDLIFCNSVLYYIDDHLTFFEHCRGLLTDDGVIAIQYQRKVTQEFLNCFEYLSYFPKLVPYFKDYQFPVFFPEINYIEQTLSKVGLKLNVAEQINHQHQVDLDTGVKIFKSGPFIPYTNQEAYPVKLYNQFGNDLLKLVHFGLNKQFAQKKVTLNTLRVYLLISRNA